MPSRSRRGFTLIELLVLIAIIAILAVILFPVFFYPYVKNEQVYRCPSDSSSGMNPVNPGDVGAGGARQAVSYLLNDNLTFNPSNGVRQSLSEAGVNVPADLLLWHGRWMRPHPSTVPKFRNPGSPGVSARLHPFTTKHARDSSWVCSPGHRIEPASLVALKEGREGEAFLNRFFTAC